MRPFDSSVVEVERTPRRLRYVVEHSVNRRSDGSTPCAFVDMTVQVFWPGALPSMDQIIATEAFWTGVYLHQRATAEQGLDVALEIVRDDRAAAPRVVIVGGLSALASQPNSPTNL